VSATVVDFTKSQHRQSQELLPWFANGTIDPDDRAFVEEHLQGCAVCRADLEWQRDFVREGPGEGAVTLDAGRELARLRLRLDPPWRRLVRGLDGWTRSLRLPSGMQRPGFAIAIALQSLAILVLAGALAWPSSPPAYRTLSAPGPDRAADIVVRFDPAIRETELRAILLASHARILDGPLPGGGYLLSVDPAGRLLALRALRGNSSVRSAEPLWGGEAK